MGFERTTSSLLKWIVNAVSLKSAVASWEENGEGRDILANGLMRKKPQTDNSGKLRKWEKYRKQSQFSKRRQNDYLVVSPLFRLHKTLHCKGFAYLLFWEAEVSPVYASDLSIFIRENKLWKCPFLVPQNSVQVFLRANLRDGHFPPVIGMCHWSVGCGPANKCPKDLDQGRHHHSCCSRGHDTTWELLGHLTVQMAGVLLPGPLCLSSQSCSSSLLQTLWLTVDFFYFLKVEKRRCRSFFFTVLPRHTPYLRFLSFSVKSSLALS